MTNPIEKIEVLKTLLEKDLISSDEYDARRSQVLDGLALEPSTAQFTVGGSSGVILQVEGPEWAGSWDWALNLDKVTENFYKLRVPNGGTARVTIDIRAWDDPSSKDDDDD